MSAFDAKAATEKYNLSNDDLGVLNQLITIHLIYLADLKLKQAAEAEKDKAELKKLTDKAPTNVLQAYEEWILSLEP